MSACGITCKVVHIYSNDLLHKFRLSALGGYIHKMAVIRGCSSSESVVK